MGGSIHCWIFIHYVVIFGAGGGVLRFVDVLYTQKKVKARTTYFFCLGDTLMTKRLSLVKILAVH